MCRLQTNTIQSKLIPCEISEYCGLPYCQFIARVLQLDCDICSAIAVEIQNAAILHWVINIIIGCCDNSDVK